MDLIGIPSQIIFGEKSFKEKCVEIKDRKTNKLIRVKIQAIKANPLLFKYNSTSAS